MKCAACGYQYVYKSVMVDQIDYFKSGKRKGEIKVINYTVDYEK